MSHRLPKPNSHDLDGRYAREVICIVYFGLSKEHTSIPIGRVRPSTAILFHLDPPPCPSRRLLSVQLHLPSYRPLPIAATRAGHERRAYVIQHAVQQFRRLEEGARVDHSLFVRRSDKHGRLACLQETAYMGNIVKSVPEL